MDNHLPVENNPDLVRDKNSKAVINTNRLAFETAKAGKEKRLQQKKDIEDLKIKMNNIETKLDMILKALDK